MLGQEGQSAYTGSTQPFGRIHAGITWDNGTVCFILQQYHLGQCGPTGGVLQKSDLCFQRCPICLLQFSIQSGHHGGNNPYWKAPWGIHYALGAAWEVSKDGSSTKLIHQLGESVTPLPASCHHGTSPTGLWWIKVKALPLEFWGKESLMPKVEEQLKAELAEQDWPSPASLEPMHIVAPPLGFEEVMTCLWGHPLPANILEVPLEFSQPEAVVEPMVVMMCASHVVQDEASGVTYMEMVTTSMGWVALRCTCLVAQTPRVAIEDTTDLP